MKPTELKKGQLVTVIKGSERIEGVITSIDTNICTFELEFTVDYQKEGRIWSLLGVPEKAIELR